MVHIPIPIENVRWLEDAADKALWENGRFMPDDWAGKYYSKYVTEWMFTSFRAAIYMIRSGQFTTEKIADTLGYPVEEVKELEKALTLPLNETNPFSVLLETL